ncbi:MAG TPA: helix-turn-helix domain-containing protein [Mycobacteriales bacterium]|nr:helix-turn-helix domain-containing protein [Mycobacteriales bacterium]
MVSELQRVVDSLGERLKRSVAVDDRLLRIQAYSPHYGPVDDTRLGSILQRQAPAESRAWVSSQGIERLTRPKRLPANDALGMLPRLCIPVIFEKQKLGYLWLIEGETALTDAQVKVAEESAAAAAVVMYRERIVSELQRSREREHLRDLLSSDPTLRSAAAQALTEDDLLGPGPVTALVVRPAGEIVSDDSQAAIDMALTHGRLRVPLRRAVHLARPDHGVLIVSSQSRRGDAVDLREVAEDLRRELERRLDDPAGRGAVVGIGEQHPQLDDAPSSYRQALRAAHVAQIMPAMGEVVAWSELGIYRTLSQLPPDQLTTDALHPGFLSLIADSNDELLSTLECFLDLAGDVKAAAEQLRIHRTSLYYRLSKIEDRARVDMSNGGDRLALHLSLKVARLAGIYPRAVSGDVASLASQSARSSKKRSQAASSSSRKASSG